MAGKGYKGKTCAYCGIDGISSTADHVIARAFFLLEDRAHLPQVPACSDCNSKKSALEVYVSAILPIASRHEDADKFQRDFVRKRIENNAKLQRDLRLDDPPQMVNIGGLIRPMHPIRIDAVKITGLMHMILQGLFYFHFGRPLSGDYYPDVLMLHNDAQAAFVASMSPYLDGGENREVNLGRGSFAYRYVRSPAYPDVTLWNFFWHNGVPLHGSDGIGANHWWGVTRPRTETVAREKIKQARGSSSEQFE
ncbi:hypothetical protein [Asticcacaulis sp. 201]|uniref:HNH endonuclease n=1 Tax=Asticcacaulis sp. 201 TaxID=3028787 RepID=UPI002915EBA9|nr:hypothetical protein [Asticcacaulis sp. 201]MDV6333078.1 hypothetical protein [Asticcacaulis sp. 201]